MTWCEILMRESEFEFIRKLVYERSRICLDGGKREMVSARLGKRLRATNLTSVTDYCELLRSKDADEELAHLIDAISTNHTFFFRENAHFDFMRDTVIPEMQERCKVGALAEVPRAERRLLVRRRALLSRHHHARGAGRKLGLAHPVHRHLPPHPRQGQAGHLSRRRRREDGRDHGAPVFPEGIGPQAGKLSRAP